MAESVIRWTDDQESAIFAPRENLLISAAAGSGKTAVLTERIFRLLTDPVDPIPLSEIVAITFTRAAAASLRAKLSARLERAEAEDPTDGRIRRLLLELPHANISTVHAFCLRIIRENTALLALPERLCIASDAQKDRLQKDCMREALNRLFASLASPDGRQSEVLSALYYLLHQGRSADATELPLRLYDQLTALEEGVQKLSDLSREGREHLRKRRDGSQSYFSLGSGALARSQLFGRLNALSAKISAYLAFFPKEEQDDEGILPHVHHCLRTVECSLSLLRQKDFDAFCRVLKHYEPLTYKNRSKTIPTSSPQGKILHTFYDTKIKQELAKLCDEYGKEPEVLLAEEEQRLSVQEAFAELLADFEAHYREEKRARGLLDYADLEHLGLQALRQSPARYCRALFVDEYQDTNRLQDVLFRECVKKDGFFFFVGDVKQSIYRFRNAAPDLFLSYKNHFPALGADSERTSLGKSVFFSENFRSDTPVIEFANDVFSVLMNDNRQKSARLYTKADRLKKRKAGEGDLPVEFILLADTEGQEPTARDEASVIAERIRTLLDEEGRRPEEIAVIAYTNPFLARVRERLVRLGIPVAQGSAGLMQTTEAEELTALCSVLHNPLNDIALVSLLTGRLFAFSSDELCTLRTYADGSVYHALQAAASDASLAPIAPRAREVLDFLSEWRQKATRQKVSDLLLDLYQSASVLSALSGGMADKEENLFRLYREAADLEALGRRTLGEFLTYLSDRRAQTFQSESDAQVQPGYVSLMTVHKSKGLEFPVCIFTQLGHEKRTESGLFLDPMYGIFHHRYDEKRHALVPMLSEDILRRRAREEDREEAKRLLYVGITRAAEKLILIHSKKSDLTRLFAEAGLFPYLKRDSIHSHELKTPVAMLLYALRHDRALRRFAANYASDKSRAQTINCATFRLTVLPASAEADEANRCAEQAVRPTGAPFGSEALGRLKAALAAEERREGEALLPAKLSVSEILHLGETNSPEGTRLSFAREERDGQRRGTAMHAFMQFCDFTRAKADTRAEARRLCARAFLTEEAASLLEHDALSAFFSSPLFSEIEKSPRVQRELRFNAFLPAGQILSSAQAGEVLIQGVIDCFYEKEDGTYAILDFKTDSVPGSRGREILKARHTRQLELYRIALEKMTGKPVSEISLYSFCLSEKIVL